MKIGLVFDDSLDFPDGVQQYLLMLGRQLSSLGQDVHYIVGETTRTDIPCVHSMSKNLRVRFNGNYMRMPYPASRKQIRALLEEEQFDVLHICAPFSPFMAGRVIKLAPSTTRIVTTFLIAPASRFVTLANRALGLLTRGALKRVDEHSSLSTVAQQLASNAYGVTSRVIPSPVELSNYRGATPAPKDRRRILFLGRLVERKGCRHLLDAVAIAEKTGKLVDVEVIIAGDGPLRGELERFATTLQTPVQFLGFIDESDKAPLMGSADVALFPSTGGESFGIVLIEACAAGAGVVLAGDNPGYRSTFEGYEDALVKVQDPHELSDRLLRALGDQEFRTRVHDWQQAHVERFDVQKVTEQILELYRGV